MGFIIEYKKIFLKKKQIFYFEEWEISIFLKENYKYNDWTKIGNNNNRVNNFNWSIKICKFKNSLRE